MDIQQQWRIFDTALSHTPDFTYIFDLEGRFTYVNRALLTLWQRPLEAAVGKNFFDLDYPPELAARLQRQIQEVIDTRQPVKDRTSFTGPTNEARDYEYIFVPVLAADGSVEAVTGSTRDITELQTALEHLRTTEERQLQIFAQAPVAIVVLRGSDFVIELANPSYRALFQGKELVGRRLTDVAPELGEYVYEALWQVLATGEPFIANEWSVPYDSNNDGMVEDHWFNVAYNPLREADGKISGIVAVLTDVTQQAVARRELERANHDLEEFAYVASHDLQEPLRMINIYTQLILEGLDASGEAQGQYAGFVRKGVADMEALIQDLLLFSSTIHREDTPAGGANLAVALDEAISVYQGRVEECGAVISADLLPTVRGDTQQMAHVFQNLLSNSLKYRKAGVPPRIRVSARSDDSGWIISFRDNGIGFHPQYARRIFGLFKRLHHDEYPGTGLGLAICKRILERYGGKMWAEGKEGEGATFFLSIPRVG